MDRSYVYAFPSVHGTTCVVNYNATNSMVNSFLELFDVWGSRGNFKYQSDNQAAEAWFECSKDFLEMLKTPEMEKAFKRMGATVTFEYPFSIHPNPDKQGINISIGKHVKVQTDEGCTTGLLMGILYKDTEYDYSTFKKYFIEKYPDYWNFSDDYWNFRNEQVVIMSALKPQNYHRLVLKTENQGILLMPLKEGATITTLE